MACKSHALKHRDDFCYATAGILGYALTCPWSSVIYSRRISSPSVYHEQVGLSIAICFLADYALTTIFWQQWLNITHLPGNIYQSSAKKTTNAFGLA
jgi:hypothetical protein